MKKILICILIFTAITVSGHEFWIQPDKFIYKRGETINLKFVVGENFKGENWSGNKDNVTSLRLYFEDVSDKNLDDNLSAQSGDSLQIVMLDEGTVMVALNTKNSFIELEGKKFNEYLREEGLTEALQYRIQNDDTLKNGLEYYQRNVKTIIQVGSKTTNTFKKRTELPLDIIPDDNPYSVSKDGNFKIRLFFLGAELKHTKIKVWHRLDDKLSVNEYITDDDGEVKFFLSPEGEWMVSCIKIFRIKNDPKAEWQSYWGSLTWGYTK